MKWIEQKLTMRIKVVHIISSLEVGGAQAVLHDIIRHLPTIEHHVIYFHDDAYVPKLRVCGVSVHHISGVRLYNPLFFIRVLRLIKKLKPDCVHTLLWAANACGRLISRLLSIPVVCVVHNQVQYHGTLRSLIDDWTLHGSYQLVAVCNQVKQSLLARHSRLRNKKIMVISNGVDAQEVVQCAQRTNITRADFNLDEQHVIFGAVGRFDAVKNFDLLISCFAQLVQQYPHVRLLLVGSGSHQELAFYARELEIEKKVIFIIGQQAYGYYPLFDCFVQPSASEGVSIALLEAMSIGLPCIVTGNKMKHAVVEHMYDGYVVLPNDSQQLANALDELINNNTSLRAMLGKQAQETVRAQWSVDTMVDAYARIFTHDQNTK